MYFIALVRSITDMIKTNYIDRQKMT